MVPGFGVSAECQSIGTIWAFVPRLWFPYSSFQQVRQPSIMSPVEEDTPIIRDTTGTVFIQGPSIVLLVWRCIMFNDSYLRACMKLWIVQRIRFPFLSLGGPRHGARVWYLNRVPKHRNHWQEVEGLLFSPQNSQLELSFQGSLGMKAQNMHQLRVFGAK